MKNYINWKRTPLGSFCEIMAPIFLMFILVYARYEIDIETIEDYSLYSLRHPLYPTGTPSEIGGFQVELTDIPEQMTDMDGFMKYVDYANVNTTVNVPVNVTRVLDVLGLDEAAQSFANLSDTVNDWTNITKIPVQLQHWNYLPCLLCDGA